MDWIGTYAAAVLNDVRSFVRSFTLLSFVNSFVVVRRSCLVRLVVQRWWSWLASVGDGAVSVSQSMEGEETTSFNDTVSKLTWKVVNLGKLCAQRIGLGNQAKIACDWTLELFNEQCLFCLPWE